MEKTTFRRFDAAEHLETEEDISVFLDDSAESGDAAVMLNALAIVARARNMSILADSIGMSRSGLYKALSPAGNPSFDLVDKIAKTMGYRVSLVKIEGETVTAVEATSARKSGVHFSAEALAKPAQDKARVPHATSLLAAEAAEAGRKMRVAAKKTTKRVARPVSRVRKPSAATA